MFGPNGSYAVPEDPSAIKSAKKSNSGYDVQLNDAGGTMTGVNSSSPYYSAVDKTANPTPAVTTAAPSKGGAQYVGGGRNSGIAQAAIEGGRFSTRSGQAPNPFKARIA